MPEAMPAVISISLALLAAILITLNWIGLARALVEKKSHTFSPPILAGVVGSLAMHLHPSPAISKWFWIPLAADPSIALSLVWMGVQWARGACRRSP